QLAIFSLAANLLAVPLVGLVLMPCALIGIVLLPLGLGAPFLSAAAAAAEQVLAIAARVAALGGAVARVPATGTIPVVAMIGGGLWLCLWGRRWRLLGLAPILLDTMAIGAGSLV